MQLFNFQQQIVLHPSFEVLDKLSQLLVVDRHHLDLGFVFCYNVQCEEDCLLIHVSDWVANQLDDMVVHEEVSDIVLLIITRRRLGYFRLLDIDLCSELAAVLIRGFRYLLFAKELLQEHGHFLACCFVSCEQLEDVVWDVAFNVENVHKLIVEKY